MPLLLGVVAYLTGLGLIVSAWDYPTPADQALAALLGVVLMVLGAVSGVEHLEHRRIRR